VLRRPRSAWAERDFKVRSTCPNNARRTRASLVVEIKEKPVSERKLIADRIKRMNLDVLAVQEAEDINTLKRCVTNDLGGLYKYSVLIEANDPRLIDVACCRSIRSRVSRGGSSPRTRSNRRSQCSPVTCSRSK
jgi:hypothetical protein